MGRTLVLKGGQSISGSVQISGDKVSMVHLLIMSILTECTITIRNACLCGDAKYILDWLVCNNVKKVVIDYDKKIVSLTHINNHNLDFSGLARSRASICLLSGYTIKNGTGLFYFPGGCNFYNRPIDLHLHLSKQFGLNYEINKDCIYTQKKDVGSHKIHVSCLTKYGPSVGATCQALFASILLNQSVIISNAALEPVIITICEAISQIGKEININRKYRTIFIKPTKNINLGNIDITLKPDLTETLTYTSAAIATRSNIVLKQCSIPIRIQRLFNKIGIVINHIQDSCFSLDCTNKPHQGVRITCDVWPSFPSDAAPMICAALTTLPFESEIWDKVYPKRDSHLVELEKLGCLFYKIRDNYYKILGNTKSCIHDHVLIAKDIRAGAALFISALSLNETITIENFEQIERGYDSFLEKFSQLGIHQYTIKIYD